MYSWCVGTQLVHADLRQAIKRVLSPTTHDRWMMARPVHATRIIDLIAVRRTAAREVANVVLERAREPRPTSAHRQLLDLTPQLGS